MLYSKLDPETNEYLSQCKLYMGGKDGSKIYFGKPVIHDKDNVHYMYPNEARLRNMNYSMTIHYDIDVEFICQYLLLKHGAKNPEILVKNTLEQITILFKSKIIESVKLCLWQQIFLIIDKKYLYWQTSQKF